MPADTPADYAALPGTYEIAAGGTLDVNGVRFSCAAASACTVYVGNDGRVVASGMVTAEHTPLLAALLESEADLAAANQNLMDTQANLDTANQNLMDRQAELDTANQNLMDTQANLDTANQNLMDTQANLDTANQNLMDRQTALDAAQQRVDDLVASGDATQGELDTANQNLMDRQGELDTANQNLMDRQGELAMALQAPQRAAIYNAIAALNTALAAVDAGSSADDVKAAEDALAAARQAIANANHVPADETAAKTAEVDGIAGQLAEAKTARTTSIAAVTKEMVIATEAGQTTDAGLGGTGATIGDQSGNYQLEIERPRSGLAVTVTVHGDSDAEDEEFEKAADLVNGQMVTREMDADDDDNVVTEVVVVYTDIDSPEAMDFDDVYTFDANPETTNGTDFQSLNIAGTNDPNIGMVKASAFTAPAGTVGTTTLSFQHMVADDPGTMDMDESMAAAMIAGTFDGAAGTYTCAADAACTVTVNTMGVVSGVSNDDDWIFTPDTDETVDVADANYLHYGFWLQKTADKDGKVTYNEVETFAGVTGTDLTASGDTGSVEGTATYTGGAAGVYVHHVYSTGGGSIKSSTSGHFRADASLTANFGGNDVAVSMADRLTGTIDNFVLQHGEANDWSVALQSDGDATADGIQADTDGNLAGTASGGVSGDDGSFTATYHGSVTVVENVVPQPAAVVGEFNSTFSNGSVAGAFGADKD